MKPGVWYEAESRGPDGKCKDRHESCRALVGEGWLQMGRIAKRGKDGTLHEYEPEELLLEAIIGDKRDRQPFEMYRIANASGHERGLPRTVAPLVVNWCGRCEHATKAFFVPHYGLCVHCCHTNESVSGAAGWASLRRYKESNGNCGSWEPREMHNAGHEPRAVEIRAQCSCPAGYDTNCQFDWHH